MGRFDFKRILVTLRCCECGENTEFDDEMILFANGTVLCTSCMDAESESEDELLEFIDDEDDDDFD